MQFLLNNILLKVKGIHMRNYKKLFIIFILLSFLLLVPTSFASVTDDLNNTDIQ